MSRYFFASFQGVREHFEFKPGAIGNSELVTTACTADVTMEVPAALNCRQMGRDAMAMFGWKTCSIVCLTEITEADHKASV